MNPYGILLIIGVVVGLALYVNFLIYEPIVYLTGIEDITTSITTGPTIANIIMVVVGFIFLIPIFAYGIIGGVMGVVVTAD